MTFTVLAIEGKVVRYEVRIPVEEGFIKVKATGRIGEPIELNYN